MRRGGKGERVWEEGRLEECLYVPGFGGFWWSNDVGRWLYRNVISLAILCML